MSKKYKAQHRFRLNSTAYRTADALAEILSNPDTPAETLHRLQDLLIELAGEARVHVYHPALVRAAFLEMCHAASEFSVSRGNHDPDVCRVRDARNSVLEAVERALAGEPVEPELTVTIEDCPADVHELYEHFDATAQPSNVVDMLCWIQSRPRPIREPLFSFDQQAR